MPHRTARGAPFNTTLADMKMHLLSAGNLGDRLAAGAVTAKEQALYVSASFVAWLLPIYFFVVPPAYFQAWSMPLGLWFYELGILVLVYTAGIFYCLERCRVDPSKHFLVDFSCLYAPVSISTLIIVWAAFHIYSSLVPWLLKGVSFDSPPPAWLHMLYVPRTWDLVRFLATVGVSVIVIFRVGRHMARISASRMSANHTVETDGLQAARRSL